MVLHALSRRNADGQVKTTSLVTPANLLTEGSCKAPCKCTGIATARRVSDVSHMGSNAAFSLARRRIHLEKISHCPVQERELALVRFLVTNMVYCTRANASQ